MVTIAVLFGHKADPTVTRVPEVEIIVFDSELLKTLLTLINRHFVFDT